MQVPDCDTSKGLVAIDALAAVGFGIGGLAALSGEEAVPKSAFQFGYADLELSVSQSQVRVSAGGKLIAGVGRDGFGLGIEGRVRIGNRDATNLQLIARTLEQIGFVTDIKLNARPASDLGFAVSVGATDQPNNGDMHPHPSIFVDARASLGVSRAGFDQGLRGQVTFGKPWRSCVQVGAEALGDVGASGWVRLQWDTAPPFLMGA